MIRDHRPISSFGILALCTRIFSIFAMFEMEDIFLVTSRADKLDIAIEDIFKADQ
jgi:hypothetical protein